MIERRIYAAYDEEGICVYQAFHRGIVDAALAKGTYGEGFQMDRMTWIKPSFGWMLYRSGYASKPNQEAILKIMLSHAGFLAILRESVEASYNPRVYASEAEWKSALSHSNVRHQWDPERLLNGNKHPYRRAIQIGISGGLVERYVNEWIIGLEDVTQLAHAASANPVLDSDQLPRERLYPVDATLVKQLGITEDFGSADGEGS